MGRKNKWKGFIIPSAHGIRQSLQKTLGDRDDAWPTYRTGCCLCLWARCGMKFGGGQGMCVQKSVHSTIVGIRRVKYFHQEGKGNRIKAK